MSPLLSPLLRKTAAIGALAAILVMGRPWLALAHPQDVHAADPDGAPPGTASSQEPGSTRAGESATPEAETPVSDQPPKPGRLFGVLPNTSTVEVNTPYAPVTTKQTFKFAVDSSFDKTVFPFVGFVALLGVGQPSEAYWQRYARALTDNAVSNFSTTAVLPFVFGQDPRFFQLGTGSVWYRLGYAASRAVVTRSRASGHREFNISEIGGTTLAGAISNAYYPAAQRTASAALARVGSQLMWDTVAFECKEFWPDIRHSLEKTFHHSHGAD